MSRMKKEQGKNQSHHRENAPGTMRWALGQELVFPGTSWIHVSVLVEHSETSVQYSGLKLYKADLIVNGKNQTPMLCFEIALRIC